MNDGPEPAPQYLLLPAAACFFCGLIPKAFEGAGVRLLGKGGVLNLEVNLWGRLKLRQPGRRQG